MVDAIRLLTPEGRFSFPNFVEPKAFQPKGGGAKGAPNFNGVFIFEPADLDHFKQLDEATDKFIDVKIVDVAVAQAKAQWPGEAADIASVIKALAFNKMWPFQDGTKLADDPKAKGKQEFLRGKKLIKAGSTDKVPPNLFVREGGKTIALNRGVPSDMQRAKALFVGGNYGYAEISCVAGETPQRHVKFYLNSVVFTRIGERLGGQSSLIGRFDGVIGNEDAKTDPTKGMSDEIPF